jgi:hypothetical protein
MLRKVKGKKKLTYRCYQHSLTRTTRLQNILGDPDPKMTALAIPVAIANDRSVLSSERAPQINKPATVRQ